MLRTTWEKTTHPVVSLNRLARHLSLSDTAFSKIRFVTHLSLPQLGVRRKILLPRPKSSSYTRPIAAYLFFAPAESELSKATDLILDCPGGGYVAMSPEHHEERLRIWAVTTGRPVLSLDYGKAPECELSYWPRKLCILTAFFCVFRSVPFCNQRGVRRIQAHGGDLYVFYYHGG